MGCRKSKGRSQFPMQNTIFMSFAACLMGKDEYRYLLLWAKSMYSQEPKYSCSNDDCVVFVWILKVLSDPPRLRIGQSVADAPHLEGRCNPRRNCSIANLLLTILNHKPYGVVVRGWIFHREFGYLSASHPG